MELQTALIIIGIIGLLALNYVQKAHKKADEVEEKLKKLGDFDTLLQQKREEAERIERDEQLKLNTLRAEFDKLKYSKNIEISQLDEDLKALEIKVIVGSVDIGDYAKLKSDEVKNQLALLRNDEKKLIADGDAVRCALSLTKRTEITAQNNQIKQILRCFNAETQNLIESVTYKNVDAVRAKISKSFEIINKLFSKSLIQISQEFLELKFKELSLVYAYMVKEQEEKEQRAAIREQMVEEEKVRREIEREKMKIEKDETQCRNEISKLMMYMQKCKDDVQNQLYTDKIKELEEKLKALEENKKNVLDREQNARAGFVYVISNIGSFGEKIYKIGMTRRLEPLDRIAELSSASVPFPFDVHAMIFSEDAPKLEADLHQFFSKERVNKVNTRKEFFRVDLGAIEKEVFTHNPTAKFVHDADAMEYRETLRIEAAQ